MAARTEAPLLAALTLGSLAGCAGMSQTGPAPPAKAPPPAPLPLPAEPAPANPVVPAAATIPEPSSPAAADPLPQLRDLHRRAADSYSRMDSYIARLKRREQVNGRDKPEELILFKFRKEPWSVYLKWLGSEGQGREALYVKGRHEDKLHTLLAAGDMPLARPGMRIALPPDSLLIRNASRHPITQAGVGSLVDRFGRLLEAAARNDPKASRLRPLGALPRPEYDNQPLDAVEQLAPPGAEAALPQGGRRLWFFDPVSHLPVIIIAQDASRHEVEYYCYDRIQSPVRLDDDDFDPDKLWGKSR